MGAVQQVNAALSDSPAYGLVGKAAQYVPEGGAARGQAAGRSWLPKL